MSSVSIFDSIDYAGLSNHSGLEKFCESYFNFGKIFHSLGGRRFKAIQENGPRVSLNEVPPETSSLADMLVTALKIAGCLTILIPCFVLACKAGYRHKSTFEIATSKPTIRVPNPNDKNLSGVDQKTNELIKDNKIAENNDLKLLEKQLYEAAPRIGIFPMENREKEKKSFDMFIQDRKAKFHNEIEKLFSFFNDQDNAVKYDLIYVCIGHGGVAEQLWPGFVFEKLKQNKKVLTILFEELYPGDERKASEAVEEYKNYLGHFPTDEEISKFGQFTVKEFLCGFPQTEGDYLTFEDTMDAEERELYKKGELGNFWENKNQAAQAKKQFESYIIKCIAKGIQVVIGDHRGVLSVDESVLKFYNRLKEHRRFEKNPPDQFSFLWGYSKFNLMTNQLVKQGDFPTTRGSSNHCWTYHPKLCTATLNS